MGPSESLEDQKPHGEATMDCMLLHQWWLSTGTKIPIFPTHHNLGMLIPIPGQPKPISVGQLSHFSYQPGYCV